MKTMIALLVMTIVQIANAGFPGFNGGSPVLEGEPIGRGRPGGQQVEISGLAAVTVETKSTVTCQAIGCPPSEIYHEVKLVLMNAIQGHTEILVSSDLGPAPQNVSLGNITVRHDDVVEMKAVVIVTRGGLSLVNLLEVQHAPHTQSQR